MKARPAADVLLVGGGLANGLIAWRLRQARPDLRVLLVERDATLGGEHTWSFHQADLTPAQHEWLAPLVARSWDGYDVSFPGFARRLPGGYHALTSRRFHERLAALLGPDALLGREARAVDAGGASLADGERLRARCVVDGRGLSHARWLVAGAQSFLGRDLTLADDHGLDAPLLMDASVAQTGGLRFFYVLPWDARRLLIEETRYADEPGLDAEAARAAIAGYARERGWRIVAVEREERGSLPIPLAGDLDDLWREQPEGVAWVGARAGLFHATTGYSLPDAVRVADWIAARPTLDGLAADLRRRALENWRRQGFLRLLNRMLFRAAAPERRARVLARFYRLRPDLIERFYAGRLTWRDRARLLIGRPPVPLSRAARCLREGPLRARASDDPTRARAPRWGAAP